MTMYVGMDVHRKRSQVAIVDDAGVQQRNRNLANDPAKLIPVLGALAPGTPVAFEAAYGWGWLVDLLEELELEPHSVAGMLTGEQGTGVAPRGSRPPPLEA
jgi:transposase